MIQIRNLYKSLAGQPVLKDIDIDILDGEILTLLGGSGVGKSVFLKNIIGLMRPDRGSIRIDETEITALKLKELSKIQRKFGMVFQGDALFDSLTVAENVAFGMKRLSGLSMAQIARKVTEYLSMVRLEGVEDKLPESLSIGMKRRVSLARSIATRPEYIFYDEPTTGLDPITTDVICNLFLDLQKELDITSVMVTHDISTAYKISDRIAFLHEGSIAEVDNAEEFKKSDNRHVRNFIDINTGILRD